MHQINYYGGRIHDFLFRIVMVNKKANLHWMKQ